MFQKTNKFSEGASINLIGNGTNIVGDISSNGDMRIDGHLKGNITISGKLVVGTSGSIEGSVFCHNADVSGEINGKITVNELLILKSSARLLGDIITEKLLIENGALYTGYTNMGAVVKNIKNATTQETTTQTA